jgi:hypothetical protein
MQEKTAMRLNNNAQSRWLCGAPWILGFEVKRLWREESNRLFRAVALKNIS